MQQPPLVDVEIILDPYVANIFPESLLPTAAYIVILAVVSFFLSGTLWRAVSPQRSSVEKRNTD